LFCEGEKKHVKCDSKHVLSCLATTGAQKWSRGWRAYSTGTVQDMYCPASPLQEPRSGAGDGGLTVQVQDRAYNVLPLNFDAQEVEPGMAGSQCRVCSAMLYHYRSSEVKPERVQRYSIKNVLQ